MKKEILNFCVKKGLLLDKDILELMEKLDNLSLVENILERIKDECKEKIITKSFLSKNMIKVKSILEETTKENGVIEKIGEEDIEKLFINLGLSIEITKQKKTAIGEMTGQEGVEDFRNFRILNSYQIPPKKLGVKDFIKCFRGRFDFLKKVLQENQELQNLVSINKLTGNRQGISVIGIVSNKRITKNKNLLIELEDMTGKINVIANQNKPEVYEVAKTLVLDDVIGIRASGSREILFANKIVYPDCFLQIKKKSKNDEAVAFTSDFHVGSSMFLEENLMNFIKWLNGESNDEKQRQEALKIKYLFITGDSVDGVGIFPGQEEFLDIRDIRKQYLKVADILKLIRKDIQIFLCPGQHDGVRVTEPQPPIGKDFAEPLHEIKNLHLVSNPAFIEIGQGSSNEEKFKVLMYHGASMHNFVNEIEELRLAKAHNAPAKIVKHLLKRRHLSPIHSLATYVPFEHDPLIIREVPDIIATGDLHRPDVDMYNNILIIASSCWQSKTPFEEKVGNNPDPCKVPIFNLKTREIKIMDFS